MLVIVTGAIGGTWAYFWQQTSTETLRLKTLEDAAQEIRTLVFRQMQEAALSRLRTLPGGSPTNFYLDIQEKFNLLRQNSASRAEDFAIQSMQEAYGQLQTALNDTHGGKMTSRSLGGSGVVESDPHNIFVSGLDAAFEDLKGLIDQGLNHQRVRIDSWTHYAPVIVPLPVFIALCVIGFSRARLARGFVRPMKSIMLGTQQIAAGEIDIRLPADGVSELADLAHGINHMAQELAGSRAALVESERQAALGALVPVVAHNIRNPLASIRANAQLVGYAESLEEATDVAGDIVDAVDRLERWVSALVSYLHPLRPRMAPWTLTEIFATVLDLLKPKLQEKEVSTLCSPWMETVRVAVDRDLMEQAIYGLLLNAVEASSPGGLLELAVILEVDHVRLTIQDHAGGIPFIPNPSDLTPGPTTKRFGTGLGIPVAFKVCKAHGWDLEFQITDKGGTLITLIAPVLEAS